MWQIQRPSPTQIERFLDKQRQLPVSTHPGYLSSYNVDEARVHLGRGEHIYSAACQALREWRMFPAQWIDIVPKHLPIEVGQTVAVVAHAFGLWWPNACRIVSVIDEREPTRRFEFTYSTLPGHVEMGDETFSVEWDDQDDVWYKIHAISKPNYWLVKLAYPLARWMQSRFRRDSQLSMQKAVRALAEQVPPLQPPTTEN